MMWPHVEFSDGSCVKAGFALPKEILDTVQHGDVVEWVDHLVYDRGIRYSSQPVTHKGVFRLIETAFDKEFIIENLPKYKQIWSTRHESND